jgi:hypothetical protein
MSKGGMQSSSLSDQTYCKCNKSTSLLWKYLGKEIAIHFTKKSTYWHIFENGKMKRTFKKPEELN